MNSPEWAKHTVRLIRLIDEIGHDEAVTREFRDPKCDDPQWTMYIASQYAAIRDEEDPFDG